MQRIFIIVACGLLAMASPALAVDDFYGPDQPTKFDDSRRPDLGGARPAAGTGVQVLTAGDSAWEEFLVQDIDYSGFLERLYVLLTNEEYLGKYKEVAMVAEYLDTTGLFDIASGHTEYQITGDHIHLMGGMEFGDLDPEAYYARYYGLPDVDLVSGHYLAPGEYMLYIALTHLPQKAFMQVQEMAKSAEMMGGEFELDEVMGELGMGDLGDVLTLLEVLEIDEMIGNVMTGELALVVYGIGDIGKFIEGDIEPQDLDIAIMLGLSDASQIDPLLARFGAEAGLVDEELDGGWRRLYMPDEDAPEVLMNHEVAVLCMDAVATAERLETAAAGGGLGLAPCQLVFDLNMAKLHEQVIGPLAMMGEAWLDEDVVLPDDEMAYLLNLPDPEALGHMTFTTYHPDGNYQMEMEMKKAVVQYLLYYLGVGLCAAGQSGAF